jgi:hypothetical protein
MKRLRFVAIVALLSVSVTGCSWPRCFSRGDGCNGTAYQSQMVGDGQYMGGQFGNDQYTNGQLIDERVINGRILDENIEPGRVGNP